MGRDEITKLREVCIKIITASMRLCPLVLAFLLESAFLLTRNRQGGLQVVAADRHHTIPARATVLLDYSVRPACYATGVADHASRP